MTIPNGKFLKRRACIFYNLIISSLIDEIHFIAKQSNASVIGISESKLDSSFLTSEIGAYENDLIRLYHSRRERRVACYIRESISYNHKTSFCRKIESNFIRHFFI